MNIQGPLVFDIQKIYALIHKREEPGFTYVCKSRAWDGFVAITDGKCTFNNKEHGDIVLSRGDIVFLRRDESYSIKADESISYYTTAFDFSPDSDEVMKLMPKVSICDNLLLKSFDQLNKSWQSQTSESYIFCKIQLLKLYYNTLSEAIEERSRADGAVNKALKFIHDNFKRGFTSEEIAAHCSLSESHLRKRFQSEMKMTILEYRDMLRFKLAKELISSGLFNIKEVSYELGFCDVYYFTKFFKRHAGITPKRFISEKSK